MKKYNVLSIVGFIFSFLFPIVGAICCLISLNQIQSRGDSGYGLAMAGLIISIVSIIASFILVPVYLI